MWPGTQPTTFFKKNGGPSRSDSLSMVEKFVTLLVLYMVNFPKYHIILKNPIDFSEEFQNTIEAYYQAFQYATIPLLDPKLKTNKF